MNWENLKYLLALDRAGSLSGAAERLTVDATTVSRRIAALQRESGAQLIERAGTGGVMLTEAGHRAVLQAEAMETGVSRLQADLTGAELAEEGIVRVSSVPVVNTRLLLPKVRGFAQAHPGIELHLASETRNVSLTRREADMAVRLGRPEDGGQAVKARRIAVLDHAVYGPAGADRAVLPWIFYHETMRFLPQARWMAEYLRGGDAPVASIRPSDLEGVVEAIAAGLGRSVVPRVIGDQDSRLERLSGPAPDLRREVWLLQHVDQSGLARMRAVSKWIEAVFRSPSP